jgi:aminomethyltransferase
MVPFAGFSMPVMYSGIIDEHNAVRNAAGIFDVSHMGEVWVNGPSAFDFVQNIVSNDISSLYDGKAHYNSICRENS